MISSIIFFIINKEDLSIPKIENIDNYEIIKNHDPDWDYIRMYNGDYRVRKKSDPYDAWNEPVEEQLIAVKKVFESAEEKKPCECGCDNEDVIENDLNQLKKLSNSYEKDSDDYFQNVVENSYLARGFYAEQLKIDKFDLAIDWGWFYFITKPLFFVIN